MPQGADNAYYNVLTAVRHILTETLLVPHSCNAPSFSKHGYQIF